MSDVSDKETAETAILPLDERIARRLDPAAWRVGSAFPNGLAYERAISIKRASNALRIVQEEISRG